MGAKPERRRGEDRGAEGAETETPKALRGRGMGKRVSPIDIYTVDTVLSDSHRMAW